MASFHVTAIARIDATGSIAPIHAAVTDEGVRLDHTEQLAGVVRSRRIHGWRLAATFEIAVARIARPAIGTGSTIIAAVAQVRVAHVCPAH